MGREELRARMDEEARKLRQEGDDTMVKLKDSIAKHDKLAAEMQATQQRLADTESSLVKSTDNLNRMTQELAEVKRALDSSERAAGDAKSEAEQFAIDKEKEIVE